MAASLTRIKRAARAELRIHKKLFAVIQFLLAVAALIYGLDMTKYMSTACGENGKSVVTYVGYQVSFFAVIFFAAGICCGFIAVINIFKDLNNVQTADVQLSLPLSAGERYASKLAALAAIHILPTVFYLIVGWLITYAAKGFQSGVTFENQKFFVMILSFSLFADAVTLFCCCCCGTFAESIYVSLITMGCISVIPYAFFDQAVSTFSGLNVGNSNRYFSYWTFSPFALYESTMDSQSKAGGKAFIIGGIISCLISLLLIAVTFLIYKKREARTVGKPIVYKLFFELFLFLGLSTVFTMAMFSHDFVMIGLVAALVIYIIIRVVVSRAKVKPLDVIGWILKYAVSLAVFVCIIGAAYLTDGFGYANYLPAETDEDTYLIVGINRYDYSETNCMIEFTDSDGTKQSGGYFVWDNSAYASKMTYGELCRIIKDVRCELKKEKSVSDFLDKLFSGGEENGEVEVYISEYSDNGGAESYAVPYNSEFYQSVCTDIDSANAIAQKISDNGQMTLTYKDDGTEDYMDYL